MLQHNFGTVFDYAEDTIKKHDTYHNSTALLYPDLYPQDGQEYFYIPAASVRDDWDRI